MVQQRPVGFKYDEDQVKPVEHLGTHLFPSQFCAVVHRVLQQLLAGSSTMVGSAQTHCPLTKDW